MDGMDTTQTNQTSQISPAQTIEQMYAAFGRGDIPGLLDLIAEDVDWGRTIAAPGGDVVPHLRGGIGKDVAVAYFTAVGRDMEFHTFAPRLMAAAGDVVLSVIDAELTVRATGKRIRFDEVHEFTVRDGKVVRYRPHVDTAMLIDAFTG